MKHARRFNKPLTYQRAKELRRQAPLAEQLVWFKLREQKPAHGLKFRRQHPVANYIADFICLECRLIVEIDGESHIVSVEKDQIREAVLRREGFQILRFSNQDVYENVVVTHFEFKRPKFDNNGQAQKTCHARASGHPELQ